MARKAKPAFRLAYACAGGGASLTREQQKALRKHLSAPRLGTAGEICRSVGCSMATLYRYKQRWGITRPMLGRVARFKRQDVERALRKGRGRTQAEIARGLGMHPSTLWVYKRVYELDPDALAERLKEARAEVRRLERLLRRARGRR